MHERFKISVLIRNLNEAKSLKRCIESVKRQVTTADVEIVVLDNESTDESVAIAQSLGCKVFTLPRNQFSYGRSLNVGIAHCTGNYILTISSHVVLITNHFIEDALPFLSNKNVAGIRFINVSSQEIIGEGQGVYRVSEDFVKKENLSPVEYWKNLIVCSCSLIQKRCWEMIAFDEKLIANEDKKWSLDILKKGFTILSNIPCYYLYYKPLTHQQRLKKNFIDTTTTHQIIGLEKLSFYDVIKMSLRPILGGLKKLAITNYYATKTNFKIYNALKKNQPK